MLIPLAQEYVIGRSMLRLGAVAMALVVLLVALLVLAPVP